MLFHTTLGPQSLTKTPRDLAGQKLYFNIWTGQLYDFVENCVVLFPENDVTPLDYLDAIDHWPAKYQKRAQELLSMLKQHNRFIPSPAKYAPAGKCNSEICAPFAGVCLANSNTNFFFDERCVGCPSLIGLNVRSGEALEYFTSEFSRRRRQATSRVLSDGQWHQSQFESEVFSRIFRTAKHVKIYDRYIGRSLFSGKKSKIKFRDSYKGSLEWIIESFVRQGADTRGGVFEIYCGIRSDIVPAAARSQIGGEMRLFEKSVFAELGLNVKVKLKEESVGSECPHGRYIITDQMALLIERGFDLLWDDAKMRRAGLDPKTDSRRVHDVAIVLCRDCSEVESQTNSLPDI